MDWDGDGLNDFVVGQGSNSSGSVQVFFNNGNGTVSDPFYVCTESGEPIKSNSGSALIQVLDFVPDGRFDLLVGMGSSTSSEFVLVFENDSDTWAPPYNPVFLEPDTLTSVGVKINHGPCCPWIGDLDNDGFPDLVVSDYYRRFFFYQGTGPMGTMDFARRTPFALHQELSLLEIHPTHACVTGMAMAISIFLQEVTTTLTRSGPAAASTFLEIQSVSVLSHRYLNRRQILL